MIRYPKPALLAALPPDRGVVQASAGTGKTWLLERMVVDLLLQGVPLERILVVTFTDKAALELRVRIREILETLVALEEGGEAVPGPFWELGGEARALLAQALRSFDRATHATIHGFCQKVLADGAFEGGALLRQELADGKALFERALREMLRTRFKGDPEAASLYAQALEAGLSVERLHEILAAAHLDRARLMPEPADLAPALARFQPSWLDAVDLEAAFTAAKVHAATRKAALGRLPALAKLMEGRPAPYVFLRAWEFDSLLKACSALAEGPGHDLGVWLREAGGGALPPENLLAHVLLPPVQAKVAALKALEGLYDYDDIILQTLQSLNTDAGGQLAARVRERFSVAIIDEFQDTDENQWGIFDALFNREGHRLYIIGDPKQAIYGFRGGDLPAYGRAVEAILGGAAPANLTDNYRSTPAMIEAYNELFTGGDTPEERFFRDPGVYPPEAVVRAGRTDFRATTAAGGPLAPVTLLRIPKAGGGEPTRLRVAAALAREIKAAVSAGVVLQDGDGPARALGYGDVRVLVGTGREGQVMARALARLGVPCVAFKQKGLFQTSEAADLLDVLRAVENPRDAGRRARAMLTPFFGYRLEDLEGLAAMPEDHPVLRRLQDWRQMGRERQFPRMLEAMLVDSGLVRRLRLRSGNERALTNYQHLAELLSSAGSEGAPGLEALIRMLNRWIRGLELPAGKEPELQRLEGQADAVQIMTLHASKGLEGGIVAVFAHSAGNAGILHRFYLGGQRCAAFDPGLEAYKDLIADVVREEEERLMYVALTRARALLILPCYLEQDAKGVPRHPGSAYRVANRRLRALALGHQRPDLFCRKDAVLEESLGTRIPDVALPGWTLPALAQAPPPDFEELRRQARPTFNASYTSIAALLKRRTQPAYAADLDTGAPGIPAPAGQLPRGPQTGQAIHELLEVEDTQEALDLPFGPWWQDPARRARVRAVLAEHDLAPKWDAPAAQMVHAALNTVLPDRDGPGGPLGVHDELLREMNFQARFLDTGDFLNGSMDAVYERDGAAYFLDWKTDTLDGYGQEALAAHVAEHFTVQCRIYTRVLLDYLGIGDEDAFERRFGGIHYVFLRGPGAVLTFRPTWAEVAGWDAFLRDLHRMVAHA